AAPLVVKKCRSRQIRRISPKLKKTSLHRENIYTYADMDIVGANNVYETLGFVKDNEEKTPYVYMYQGVVRHKSFCKKDNLLRNFPEVYDPNLTEFEMVKQIPGLLRLHTS